MAEPAMKAAAAAAVKRILTEVWIREERKLSVKECREAGSLLEVVLKEWTTEVKTSQKQCFEV
jgi:hypothetical protein